MSELLYLLNKHESAVESLKSPPAVSSHHMANWHVSSLAEFHQHQQCIINCRDKTVRQEKREKV